MKWKIILPLAVLFSFSTTIIFAQRLITGAVTDSAGNKLQSVSVSAVKSSAVAVTDANGSFRITVPPAVSRLQFSFVGYQRQVIDIGGKTTVNVTMQSAAGALQDVVVVGYGTQRKRDVTGTISSVRGESFKNTPVSNAAVALQG